jgi:hypothetical protein
MKSNVVRVLSIPCLENQPTNSEMTLVGRPICKRVVCVGGGGSSVHYYATHRKVAGSIPDEANFKMYLKLPAALSPGVYSASNRNEYRKH